MTAHLLVCWKTIDVTLVVRVTLRMKIVIPIIVVMVVMMKHTSSLGENGKIRRLRLQKALKTVDLVVLRKRRSKFFAPFPSYHHHHAIKFIIITITTWAC